MAARMELRVEWKRREEESEAAASGEWWWKLLEVVHRYYRTYVMFICIVQITYLHTLSMMLRHSICKSM